MKLTICYDIISDKTRQKIVKILSGYGYRVQKSVFEAILSKDDFLEMKSKIDKVINKKEDSVRYYLLCKGCDEKIEIQGVGKKIEEVKYIII